MINWDTEVDLKKEFEEKVLENMNSLFNLALKLTRNRDNAADLVQDATLRAFRFYHQFQQGTNFKAWILTILRNTFINQYRKRVKEPPKVNYDELENVIEDYSLSKISGVQEEIFGENLQVAVDRLPEELRTAVTLFYVDGLAYKEIAQVMGCPIGTVMSRLYTARKILKKILVNTMKKEARQNEI